jgi:hypothetical protein
LQLLEVIDKGAKLSYGSGEVITNAYNVSAHSLLCGSNFIISTLPAPVFSLLWKK